MAAITVAPAPDAAPRPFLSPLNQRRLSNFRANRRGFWSFRLFMLLFVVTLFAELLANDRPLFIRMEGQNFYPILFDYSEKALGGEFETPVDFKEAFMLDLFEQKKAFLVWPLIRHSYSSTVKDPLTPFPSAPTWAQSDKLPDCVAAEAKPRSERPAGSSYCQRGNWNWLGTDDQGRDVVARIIYGFRISVLFGLTLTIISSVIGIAAGAVQGYFGGWTDLLFQRFIEIWTAIPSLYLLLIISSVLAPSFFVLLGILLLFSWVSLVGLVRAEFLRARNFEYVKAARALGVGSFTLMRRHLLPNAMVATITFLPFILSGSVMTLTALDFLGFGLPVGSPSLGELLQQGKSNLQAPWLALTAFVTIAVMLSLLIFVGEAVRDAFDPRKTFA
ncbi:ABC transporter permease [Phreatobacter aquaticus]|uniref:ABC transporter permease n=1 Tax=Phreatobacter aquaticus TaxID=2570229 RepID=A0A4D7QGP1_9HYPH|nr:ABC transporter permease [Phreatobacter aquaticus]QCK85861.1 ABC transporter permease [Phreatobacter aquaticus]